MLQEKRKKAQSIIAQNKNPRILSRGGYRKLKEKIMSEKKKFRPPPSEGEDIEPPSPPSCHEKWKLARGEIFEAGTILHGMKLSEDEVKVIVEEVLVLFSLVLVLTHEVYTMAHAFQCFLA